MADAAAHAHGRIGPNALIQLADAVDQVEGVAARKALFTAASVPDVPDGSQMIDQRDVAAVHQALRRALPDTSRHIARIAGDGTAGYILAIRIPRPARAMLRALPAWPAMWLLNRAITAHAWTFCGTGHLTCNPGNPTLFEIKANPIVAGETAPEPVCDWHAAVFERLFSELVHPGVRVREVTCCAAGADACRFEVDWHTTIPRDAAARVV